MKSRLIIMLLAFELWGCENEIPIAPTTDNFQGAVFIEGLLFPGIGQNCILLELGSGSSRKVRILLERLSRPYAYFPVDISQDFVTQEAKALKRDYPTVVIHPIFADYTRSFELPKVCFGHRPCVYFYPGSSIGNFPYPAAQKLFENLHQIQPTAHLLIGIDLKKDRDTLEKAYNDSKGITARFNLNVLDHVNELVGNCFQPATFEHYAFYNEKKGRIEMHLRSLEAHKIQLNGEVIPIKKDETILTEYSYKYDVKEFSSILNGFYSIQSHWTDSRNLFALLYCKPRAGISG